ncbi:interleukin-12 receptor subunit beta-2 [Ctenodactylus gundi]
MTEASLFLLKVIPDQPRNVSCKQRGQHGKVTCSWDPGRDTYLYTKYTLQLHGPRNLTWQKKCYDHSSAHLNLGDSLTPDLLESSFSAIVTASNSLGNSSSSPAILAFWDIAEFPDGSSSRCVLRWRDEGWVQLSRLRYQPFSHVSWRMVNVTDAVGRHDLLGLVPFTEYKFQVSSKLHLSEGSWSDWSGPLRARTPEGVPTGMLDVWYMTQPVGDRRQQITLFWKNLSVLEARGEILHYQVTLQEVTRMKITLRNITAHTSWTWHVSRTGTWTAAVSAVNSKGHSPLTRVNITDLCGQELLAPRQVSAKPKGADGITVAWQPPEKAASAVERYLLDWRVLQPGGSTQPPLRWLQVPAHNASALISEDIKPGVCYEIRVHALAGHRGGCHALRGDSERTAPLSGPHIEAVMEEEGSVWVSWAQVPAEEQRGCILWYRLYWEARGSGARPGMREIPYRLSQTSCSIRSLQPQVTYVLWMTALTAAGEGPPGNAREFCLRGQANWNAAVAPSICIAVLLVGLFSVRYFRQKVSLLLSALRPQWCSREIPDPANSTWAKKYPVKEEKLQLPWDGTQMSQPPPEEPEPLLISEVLRPRTPVVRHHQCPQWSEERRGDPRHFVHKEDTMSSASSPPPQQAVSQETGPLGGLYKVLGSRSSDPQPGASAREPQVALAVDCHASHEGYLPSAVACVPLPDTLEESVPQPLALSVFASLPPLTLSGGHRLTLGQVKLGCDALRL